jgi:hypothetical protein
MKQTYETIPIDEVMRANSENFGHFFEPAAIRFFNSRCNQYAALQDGLAYFVTSEKFNDETGRKYTIRVCCLGCGAIQDINGFQKYERHDKALADMTFFLENIDPKDRPVFHHHKMQLVRIPCPNDATEKAPSKTGGA